MTPGHEAGRPADGAGESSSIADLLRLDSVCDAFEESWKAGSRPRLEEYLESTNLPSATLFVELVQIDIDYRRRHGESPSVGEYAAQFPQFEEALSEIASLLGTTDATVSVPAKPLPMLGRFELAAELGRGSFGVVWKAWDTKMRRWVALKQFHEGIARGNRKLYEREARAVAQLDHPNVVRVLELSEGSSSDYIVFELIEGESLKSWLTAREGKPVDPRLAAEIVLQIAQGLQHVHERDIVHRDLKPGNILITKEGVPKLVDFGLARHLDSLSTIAHDKTLLGTIPYMSPEQCRSEKVTASTDIYSLGVVLYELLAGRRPFAGVQSELLAQIQYRTPLPLNAGIPVVLNRICRRSMEKEAADRYLTAKEMVTDLERFLNGLDLEWGSIPFRKVARVLLSRRSILTCGAGIAAACGANLALIAMQAPDDGLMRVRLKTEPAGAKVAFIPLDLESGRPVPQLKIEPGTVSPVDLRLTPGDYLVVAYFDDGTNRFHEVYRHVPRDPAIRPGSYRQARWTRESDGVSLPTVRIPGPSVMDGMAFVDSAEMFPIRANTSHDGGGTRTVNISSFYVDRHELTIGEYKQLMIRVGGTGPGGAIPPAYEPDATDSFAKQLSWDEAIDRAEDMGKRLLTEWEFELISTARGNSKFPWGNDLPVRELMSERPGPVGVPQFDRFLSNGLSVEGLGSNVAEWVDSGSLLSPRFRTQDGLPESSSSRLRAVRGDHRVFGSAPPEAPIPGLRSLLPRHAFDSFVGLRCARSSRPRLIPSQFVDLMSSARSE